MDQQRQTDIDLSAVDIQVKFDGLEAGTLLNVSTVPVKRTYKAGEEVRFLSTSNYPAFIDRAEIRIFDRKGRDKKKPVALVPVTINGEAGWIMPEAEAAEFAYVLRVYDKEGRFDETAPLTIARTDRDLKLDPQQEKAVAPGMGEDRTAIRNIPVSGGAVTVHGRNVPAGHAVQVFGQTIPTDRDQAFVVQRILPPGDHSVDVAVKGAATTGGKQADCHSAVTSTSPITTGSMWALPISPLASARATRASKRCGPANMTTSTPRVGWPFI